MTTFALRPQGFVFEVLCDYIIAYPITKEATMWLNLIEEALWPGRDFVWVNGGHTVHIETEWPEFFMEVYHAGWRWSFEACERQRAGKTEVMISKIRRKPPAAC